MKLPFVEMDFIPTDGGDIYNPMNYSLLRSKTFWTFVAMFVIGGGNAIVPVLPPSIAAVVMFVLGAAGSYFHLGTAQSAGAIN